MRQLGRFVTAAMQAALSSVVVQRSMGNSGSGVETGEPEGISDVVSKHWYWAREDVVTTDYLGQGRYRAVGQFVYDETSDLRLVEGLRVEVDQHLNGVITNETGSRPVELAFSFHRVNPGENLSIGIQACGAGCVGAGGGSPREELCLLASLPPEKSGYESRTAP